MIDQSRTDKVSASLNEILGTGWANRRVELYVSARIAHLEQALEAVEKELAFERKVNDRVNEIFKGWFHREG